MFIDEEEIGGGSFSFGELARQEASRIGSSLTSVQDLLHQPPRKENVQVEDVEPVNVVDEEENDGEFGGFHHYRRYESAGYDAHSDCVDLIEVSSWQNAFTYLRITGTQIPSSSSGIRSDAVNDPSEEGVEFVLSSSIDSSSNHRLNQTNGNIMTISVGDTGQSFGGGPCDLMIEGRKIVIGHGSHGVVTERQGKNSGTIIADEGNDDDVDIVHGVLEEIVAMDVESTLFPRKTENNDDNVSLPPSPQTSKQEEIVSLLMDVVWPEVVETMRPLVCAVVKLSRERGIVYELEEEDESSPKVAMELGGGGGDRWIESDDEF